jgi:hypothetical protein
MQGDPVKEFREGIGRDCDKMKDLARVSKTGKGIDGRPLDPKTLQDYIPVVNAVIAACANPTVDTVRGVMEIFTDRKIKTCKVSNFYSKMQFKWNEQTQNWFSQEGPFGPCGTINIFSLRQTRTQRCWVVVIHSAVRETLNFASTLKSDF